MPIYEYQCKKCNYKFEQLQKVTEKPLRLCPQCKKGQVEKLISNTSFQLKGTGWYVTDFRDKNKQNNKTQSQDSPPTIVADTPKNTTDTKQQNKQPETKTSTNNSSNTTSKDTTKK